MPPTSANLEASRTSFSFLDTRGALTEGQSRACGSVLGALVGDAAGGVLEFMGRAPTRAEASQALKLMPGGGVFRLAPGQITDDGEMTLSLLRALASQAGRYDADVVAHAYTSWAASNPFDIGQATRLALDTKSQDDPVGLVQVLQERAFRNNRDSKANGALMRATPLGLAGALLPKQTLVDIARTDARMTHPHVSCQHASASYALAIRHLLLNPGDNHGAFNAVRTHLDGEADAGEVGEWLADAASGRLQPAHPLAGFVRHGFTRAFYHLRRGTEYSAAVLETLVDGGDTDTNACIVGGLIGALHGLEGIPLASLTAVLECDTDKGRSRPREFTTAIVSEHLLRLCEFEALVTPAAAKSLTVSAETPMGSGKSMPTPSVDLPPSAVPLNLKLSFPLSTKSRLEAGSDPYKLARYWFCLEGEWLRIWRGRPSYGEYRYALRMRVENDRLRVVESWGAGAQFRAGGEVDDWSFVAKLLDLFAGVEPEGFDSGKVKGTRQRKKVEFSGMASTLADVEQIAACLRSEVALMIAADHDK